MLHGRSIRQECRSMDTQLEKDNRSREKSLEILDQLALLSGFPKAVLKEELFPNGLIDRSMGMDEIREAMLKYLNRTFEEMKPSK